MAKKTRTLILRGEMFGGPADGTGPMRFLGEASKVEVTFDQETKNLKNYSTPGGGNADTVSWITNVKLSVTTHGFDVENLALATFGESGAITGGSVTNEDHIAYKGGYIRVAAGIDLSAVTVTKGVTPLVAGTDYEVKGGGIQILSTTTAISDGDTVTIDYTHAASKTVEGILNSGVEYRLTFDGVNIADEESEVVLDVWKAKATPSSVGLVSDDFGGLTVNFDIIKDDTKGVGESKFFKITQKG